MSDVIVREIEKILAEPSSSILERERFTLDRLLEETGRNVVLFGAGGLGKQTLACLRSIQVEPLAFSDNNPSTWNTDVNGVTVLQPDIAAARFGAEALFIVTIWNPYHWYTETERQLEERGCRHIAPPAPVYWRFADEFLPFYAQDLPHNLYAEGDQVLEAASIWNDDFSRHEYLRQIAWRACGSWSFRRSEYPESYFLSELFTLRSDEMFVDCGAFDGDTLRAFLSRQDDAFRRFIAIEPDQRTFSRLEAFVAGLAPRFRDKITTVHSAVGSERSMISFDADGGLSSRRSPNGASLVESVPIDELVDSYGSTTFIKMDIEGAEWDALQGARRAIARDQPLLAVCVYHKQRDLWQLPLLMKRMVPDHELYLRCHEGDGWQTVAYAVPPERVVTT